jgi:hypothetical protein
LVVVIPDAPSVIAEVFVAPRLRVPFVEVPVPAVRTKFPPVEVAPDSLPPFNVNDAPFPEPEVLFPGWKVKAVGEVPARVVISAACPPAKVWTPADETEKLDAVSVKAFAPSVHVDGEAPVRFKAADELIVTTPLPCPMLDVPVDESELKAPVEAVVAPMAVELIPVAVVLKLEDVIVKALEPVLILDADSPDNARAPDVPVKLIAPVVTVKPFDAVSSPAEVIVPVLVVVRLPVVEMEIFEAKSLPVTDANVGNPEAFP